MHRLRHLPLLLAAVTAVTFTLTPDQAHADRRSSLGGNLLIDDTDDVFIFPHRALEHVRLVTFDFGLNPGENTPGAENANGLVGNAGLIFGDENAAFGIFTHRNDFLNALPVAFSSFGDVDLLILSQNSGNANPGLYPFDNFGGAGFQQPLQWIDGVAAFNLGGGELGVRLSVAHARDNSETDNDGAINTTQSVANALNLIVGYGLEAGDLDLDISGELTFGTQRVTDDPDGDAKDETTSSSIPTISVLARGRQRLARGVKFGMLGLLDFRGVKVESDVADTVSGTTARSLGIELGAGPIYEVTDRFTLATYATLGLRRTAFDPETNSDSSDDERTNLILTLPQLRISGEFQVLDWLQLRTGVQYAYFFNINEEKQGENNVAKTSDTANAFRWIAGVGIDLRDKNAVGANNKTSGLMINATLNHDFLLNGPHFIGGSEGMAAMLNLTYDFD